LEARTGRAKTIAKNHTCSKGRKSIKCYCGQAEQQQRKQQQQQQQLTTSYLCRSLMLLNEFYEPFEAVILFGFNLSHGNFQRRQQHPKGIGLVHFKQQQQ